ncbi:DUF1707 domain-containing protein [Nonomuraea sp. NPDC050404]|uniref:DUF1707 domain-containing protein n=1 Tax=Nonomuraea sp. NPDC050404 TaxID=3155783 RepID=UPI0033C6B53B
MSEIDSAETPLWRLLRPGQIPVSAAERQAAADRIDRAAAGGSLSAEQAAVRHAQLSAARTRRDVAVALSGLPGADPAVLPRLLSLVTLVWLGLVLIQLAVWLMICFVGGEFVDAWWLWSVIVGGAVVGVLWLGTEAQYRDLLSKDRR